MVPRPFLFGVIALVCASQLIAQSPSSDATYIEKIFQTRIGEVPKMGWFDPSRGFLTSQDAPAVTLYAPAGMPASGQRTKIISGAEVRGVQKLGLACETPAEHLLTIFATGPVDKTGRALYTTKKLPGESRSGLIPVPLDAQRMAAVNRVLGWPAIGALRRDEAIGVRPESHFYSLHKLYSSTTRLLRQEAIILHGRNGQIIALTLHRNLDTEPFCADCANPTYEDDGIGLYRPLNVFELPGFTYPLLLTDSGTFEGRALSLVTFTPVGKRAEFRVYEYVVNCG